MLKEKKGFSRKKLNKAIDESIDEISDTTKKSSRKIFDALIEEGVQTISHIFDKYKIIVKHKVIKNEQEEDRDSE
jgi:hypothetical protein